MKKLNFSLFLVAGILASAQSSITRTAIDKINVPLTFRAGDVASTVTAGASGANVTWDFSAYTVPNTSTSTTNVCPENLIVLDSQMLTGLQNLRLQILIVLLL